MNYISEIFKKNPDKEIIVKVENNQSTEKATKFENLGNDPTNALTFATQNVDKYYPDMKKHLTTMTNSFRDEEHQDATIKLLDEMVENISDPAQKTGAIIYALEWKVFYKGTFAKKYDSQITDETFDTMEEFKKKHNTRLKNRLTNIEEINKRLEKSRQDLEENKQELENILNKITIQDVKTKEEIKNLVTKTKVLYTEYNYKKTKHIDELFKLIP